MKSKPDEDAALFREATRGVKPLVRVPRVVGDAPKPRKGMRVTRAERLLPAADLPHGTPDEPELAPGDASRFARAGVTPTTLRKLRRGQYPVQAQLDLHGLTQAEARIQLREFLITALERDHRCVRIVHGKGLRSPKGPVLRTLVNGILRHTRQVLAFTSARPIDGGTGALYVLLEPNA